MTLGESFLEAIRKEPLDDKRGGWENVEGIYCEIRNIEAMMLLEFFRERGYEIDFNTKLRMNDLTKRCLF